MAGTGSYGSLLDMAKASVEGAEYGNEWTPDVHVTCTLLCQGQPEGVYTCDLACKNVPIPLLQLRGETDSKVYT